MKSRYAGGALALAMLAAAPAARADSAAEIDARSDEALSQCYAKFEACKSLGAEASGVLIFPSITKGGLIVGGEYGEGALRVGGGTVGYYSLASGSIGLQAGVASRTQIFLFLTPEALDRFRASNGWEVGADANVTVVKSGASGEVTSSTANNPIAVFIFGESGLMAGVSVEGAKLSPIER